MALRVQRLPTTRAAPSLHKSVATRCRYVRGGGSRWRQALAKDHVARWERAARAARGCADAALCVRAMGRFILRTPRVERWRDDVGSGFR